MEYILQIKHVDIWHNAAINDDFLFLEELANKFFTDHAESQAVIRIIAIDSEKLNEIMVREVCTISNIEK